MQIPLLTTASIIEMRNGIAWCLAQDDALPVQAREYGVREYPDWRCQADAFQNELHRRKVRFSPIIW